MMPIVIKEIVVKTTVEKNIGRVSVDEVLVQRIKEQVKAELRDEESLIRSTERSKNR